MTLVAASTPRRAFAWLAACLTLTAVPAAASDYAHSCRSADGLYVIEDGALMSAEDQAAGRNRSLNYQVLEEIVLRATKGYCVAETADGPARYGHEYRSYVLRIAFRQAEGERVELTALCELASDGLPAALSCTKSYTTLDWRLRAAEPKPPETEADATRTEPAVSLWDHNGSLIRLRAEGHARTFVYERPRKGLAAIGVRPGQVLFDGTRQGGVYEGNAFVFSSRCGARAFAVSGDVSADERRVVLSGDAPTVDANCQTIGTRPERLEFSLSE